MAITDRFGLPLTTQSAQAAESYGRGVDLLLSANTGGEALLDAALTADPEFALAHIARAPLCQMRARIETGDVAAGAREVERALALNPHNAFAAHARVHGYFEAGDADSGAAFIAAWLPGYERRSQLHCHLSWHLALFELARGQPERARALYEDAIRPAVSHAPPLFNLADAASFLWRWRIYGETPPLDEPWNEVIAHAQRHFPRAGVHFADVHAAFAEAVSGEEAGLAARIAQLGELEEAGRLPQGAVIPALCAGAGAFAREDYAAAADALNAALPELARLGGSHAQREVFEDTYIAACLRAGRHDK